MRDEDEELEERDDIIGRGEEVLLIRDVGVISGEKGVWGEGEIAEKCCAGCREAAGAVVYERREFKREERRMGCVKGKADIGWVEITIDEAEGVERGELKKDLVEDAGDESRR